MLTVIQNSHINCLASNIKCWFYALRKTLSHTHPAFLGFFKTYFLMFDRLEGHKEKIIRIVFQGLSTSSGILFHINIPLFCRSSDLRYIMTTQDTCFVMYKFYNMNFKFDFYWCRKLNFKILDLWTAAYVLIFHVNSSIQYLIWSIQ